MPLREIAAVIASLCLLTGAAGEAWTLRPPPDASPYHARCRQVAATMPYRVGDWTARDFELTRDAEGLLRPNVFISRDFTNDLSGQHVSLLIVQVDDARHITSHYPPICYTTAKGMDLVSAQRRAWTIGSLSIPGTEYEFRCANFGPGEAVIVENFMLLPDGRIAPNMELVKERTIERNRYFGAGQVQLVFATSVPRETRDAVMAELIEAYRPLIETVLNGTRNPKASRHD